MNRTVLPLVLAALLGAALATWLPSGRSGLFSEAQAALPPAPEWSFYCFEAQSAAEVNEKANQAAARGWELFAGSPGPRAAIWCLRRPGPSPLRESPAP